MIQRLLRHFGYYKLDSLRLVVRVNDLHPPILDASLLILQRMRIFKGNPVTLPLRGPATVKIECEVSGFPQQK